jgi:outer membrane murein-binding lipoprotein Lpp
MATLLDALIAQLTTTAGHINTMTTNINNITTQVTNLITQVAATNTTINTYIGALPAAPPAPDAA